MNKEKILCTICARGGSEGVKNKNIKMLAGKPLIAYTIEVAKNSGLLDHIVVSTDSDEIAYISISYSAEVFFKRPSELATSMTPKLPVIKHALIESEKYYNTTFDIIIDLDPTSPLRTVEDIKNAFEIFKQGNFDNLITGTPSRRSPYFNLVELDENGRVHLSKELDKPITRRQDSPKCYDMNASIYIWYRDSLLMSEKVIGDNTGIYVMPPERSIDIDSELDFLFVEFLINFNGRGK